MRDREAVRSLEAFTSTLREEIDLDQLRQRFLTIIQQTMRPYALSLWIRSSNEQQRSEASGGPSAETLRCAQGDSPNFGAN